MKKKIHLVSVSSDICEDSYDEGEGSCTGCGLDNERIGRDFNNKKEMLEWLSEHYGLTPKEEDYECDEGRCETDRLVADHSNAQNGGWFEPTKEEIAKWKKGKMKLYTEHYRIRFHEY